MLAETDQYLEARLVKAFDETNANVYDNKRDTYNLVPHCIYFYYVRFGSDGLPEIKHYFVDYGQEIPYADVDAKITELAKNARYNWNRPGPNGRDFQGIAWNRISYMALMVDSPFWKMWKRKNKQVGVKFVVTDDSVPNHSFFDAKDLEVDIGGDIRDAVVMINYVRADSDGRVLGENQAQGTVSEPFHFDVYFDVGTHQPGAPSSVFIIDPGGNNMGPPVPPPNE